MVHYTLRIYRNEEDSSIINLTVCPTLFEFWAKREEAELRVSKIREIFPNIWIKIVYCPNSMVPMNWNKCIAEKHRNHPYEQLEGKTFSNAEITNFLLMGDIK